MKRVVKKTNKKRDRQIDIKLCFVVISVVYLMSCILLKNHNISLDHQLNNIAKENKTIVEKNQVLKLRIDELSSFERMNSIAKRNGLENREGTIKNVK